MTKMQDAEDGKSGTSGKSGGSTDKKSEQSDQSGSIGEREPGGKKGRKQKLAEALDRKKLAEDNRKLAESAGQMVSAVAAWCFERW